MLDKNALSLYLHIPFCLQKCGYCDFASMSGGTELYQSYTDALCADIRQNAAKMDNANVHTVFIGGGTPSVLPYSCVEKILRELGNCYSFDVDAEITMEANPETLSFGYLRAIRQCGINRLSMGVQSFENGLLRRIGRVHNAQRAVTAYHDARKAGFDNINLDLMFTLPGQTLENWQDTLAEALRLEPEHLSCYSLILEEDTPMGRENPQLPDEQTDRQMYYHCVEILAKHGYHQYEISNFARPQRECRHNIVYWTGGNYLGLGLAAHSLLNGQRFHRTGDLQAYISSDFADYNEEILSELDKIAEFMFLGLRMTDGISTVEFQSRFGKSIEEVFPTQIKKLEEQKLLQRENDRLFLTKHGIDISNQVFIEFLP